MTYTMTDDRRKLLTEKVLGECWHDFGEPRDERLIPMCGKCNQSKMFPWVKNRTFTTPQDMHDVFKKLVDDGKWDDFFLFANEQEKEQFSPLNRCVEDYVAWLFYSPERFNWLVSEWMKDEKMHSGQITLPASAI